MSNTPSDPPFDFAASDHVPDWYPGSEHDDGEPIDNGSLPRRTPRTLAPNLTRRSHKKSRAGCFNCKTRKIKCQETRPSCENCQFKSLECGYPSQADQKIIRRASLSTRSNLSLVKAGQPKLAPSPASLVVPSLAGPGIFNMDDMRFFHHYMTAAYPHLPLGNESVWLQQIPVFAHQHEYLMHALLALGASHLTRVSPGRDYSTTAIVHRGKAIKGLNEALAKADRGFGESDALLAACYALTFQASYMGDGMADFLTMVRGCALVTHQIDLDQSQTAFNLEKDIHYRLMEPRMQRMPTLDPALITPAITSTQALRPLLRTTIDHRFHTSLLAVLFALQESSRAGYLNFISVYHTFYETNHDQFNVFIDINNIPSQLLMTHFIALQMIMAPLMVHESPGLSDPSRVRSLLGQVEWVEKILDRLPAEMTGYMNWPRETMETLRREIEVVDAGTHRSTVLKILSM